MEQRVFEVKHNGVVGGPELLGQGIGQQGLSWRLGVVLAQRKGPGGEMGHGVSVFAALQSMRQHRTAMYSSVERQHDTADGARWRTAG